MCTGYITVKNLFHKVYMARLPLRKTQKKHDPAAALQLRFISRIAYGASTIAENSKNGIRRRPYN